jgi:PiT family inorganic phosphate transporter
LLTWWKGIPTSSSHALLGGYAGAAIFNSASTKGFGAAGDAIIASGWTKTALFIVVAPVLGLLLANGLMSLSLKAQEKFPAPKAAKFFSGAQMFSSAFLSLMHGSNDAQKAAGIMAGALLAGGFTQEFTIPDWVLWLSYGTMGLGTLAGGWRIVDTLGRKLTRLKPVGGFCAESSAALSILLATLLHLPVSTTHVTTGAILGVGYARNPRAVRWTLAGQIVWAWVLTIPCSAAMGGFICWVASVCNGFK